tara:strand:- start:3661 stop:4458 length:798 start_codon:yes stop_codon:yes gene_type:complete
MTDWNSVIPRIAAGNLTRINNGSFKTIYLDTHDEKVYAKEKARKNTQGTKVIELLRALAAKHDVIRLHVLIPDEIYEKAGYRYYVMPYCAADLDVESGETRRFLGKYNLKRLEQNFSALEQTVTLLHKNGLSCLDIKPMNMLFVCGKNDTSIKLTDLDSSLINMKGRPAQTLNYNYLRFGEDFKKQDLFALYKSIIEILNGRVVDVWNYKPMLFNKTVRDWTNIVRQNVDGKVFNELMEKYLLKLEELEGSSNQLQSPRGTYLKY